MEFVLCIWLGVCCYASVLQAHGVRILKSMSRLFRANFVKRLSQANVYTVYRSSYHNTVVRTYGRTM